MAGTGAFGLKDDAAVLAIDPDTELVLTKDMIVSGVHFFPDDPPDAIARKALRVNLSDLAAKGAKPVGFLLGLGLPPGVTESWIAAFASGLGADAAAYGCPLLGGDTVRSPGGLVLSVTAFGVCPRGRMVQRTTGLPGMILAVTGTIGDAALGLQLRLNPGSGWGQALPETVRNTLLDRYLHPQPRTHLASIVRAHAAAAMDISDGLLGDAAKLAASATLHGLTCAPTIDLRRIPLSQAAAEAVAREPALVDVIATGGDDYEILMALEPAKLAPLQEAARALGVEVTAVGELTEAASPSFIGPDGQLRTGGPLKFEHQFEA